MHHRGLLLGALPEGRGHRQVTWSRKEVDVVGTPGAAPRPGRACGVGILASGYRPRITADAGLSPTFSRPEEVH